MLITPVPHPARVEKEGGFTAIEIMIVTLIMGTMLAIGGAGLISMSKSASRTDTMVGAEQASSTTLTQIERDVRSATALTFATGADSGSQMQLAVLQPDGGTTQDVRWVYDSTAKTLTRQTLNGTVWNTSAAVLNQVSNGSSPLFSYYDPKHSSLSSTNNATISLCATDVAVDIQVTPKIAGVATFHQQAEVALTNNLNTLTAPGNGQCSG